MTSRGVRGVWLGDAPSALLLAASLLLSACGGEHGSSVPGRIAFDNFDDVWTIDADGTGLTRLTRRPGPDFDPSWSPDGTQIAYRSERCGEPEIWIMDADGTGQRRLTEGFSPAHPSGSARRPCPTGPTNGGRLRASPGSRDA